ncbi:MAG TPA: MG2 domain-containing protein, partial [Puia sp.]
MTLKTTWLLAITLISYKVFFGQTPFPYEKTWKRIDSLIQKKGLSKSALEEVNKLYAAAKKEKQEAQWVKAVIYRQQLLGTVDEDINRSRLQGEEEIRLAPPRVSAWLKSLEAEQLYDYLRQNRYRLSDRTEVQNDSSEDMGTWTAGKLNKKIRELYLGSLENETLLQQTGLAGFDVLITKGNSRYLRPTLYDLLANRALTYFQNDDPEQPLAEDAFVMDDPAIFLPGTQFMDHSFRSGGRSGNHLTALNIFQSLERFHSRDARPDARLDATVSRIAFAYRYAVMPEKDSLYFSALRRITDQYPSLPAAAQAWYLQATFYSQNAASFDPLSDSSHQYDYVKAKTICEQVLLQKDSSEGKTNCSTLLNNITRPAFSLETEKVNLPDQPFRILLTYKNVGHLYARIIRVDDATVDALTVRGPDQKFWKKLTHFPVLKTFDQSLPETGDYQQHRVEIRADALPPGQYALFTSSDPSFDDKAVLAAQFFFCSSIAFVNYGQDYFVADRNTGEPLTELEVRSLYRVYDSRQQKYVFRKSKIYKTDQHGYFRLAPDKEDRYLERRLEFYHGKDYLSSIGARVYSYSNTEEEGGKSDDARTYEKKMRKDILFTDRAIYRPGQTIYFKGLLVTRDFLSGRYKIVTGSESRLYLLDANDQRVDSVLVSPDEFGSFHGSFHLPVNLLNGEFRLRDSLTEDSKSFSVEEYKRPKFFVAYDPVKGSYRIGDTIHISGYAKAYAGNALDGSKVSYRVFRETRFPYSWFFRRIPSNAEQEITHGESVTNAGGQFKIDFKANADQNIDKKSGPVFSYRIETDITDLNGETRSAFTSVAASYRSFEIFSPLPSESRIELDSFHQIAVSTRNASGEFLPELLTLSFYRLKTPDRLIRKRYWDQPDQFVMTKEEYISSFPHDEYKNETSKASWEKGKMVLEKTDSTRSNG